jgi:hypothetical protein
VESDSTSVDRAGGQCGDLGPTTVQTREPMPKKAKKGSAAANAAKAEGRLNLRMSVELLKEVTELAAVDGRSASSYIVTTMRRHVEAKRKKS